MKLTPEQQEQVQENLNLVHFVLTSPKFGFSLLQRNRYYEDMISEGFMALCTASINFDPTVKCEFSTYACTCIKGAVQRALYEYSHIIHIPKSAYTSQYKEQAKSIQQPIRYSIAIDNFPSRTEQEPNEHSPREWERLMKYVPLQHRPLFEEAYIKGTPRKEMAKQRGVTKQCIHGIIRQCMNVIREHMVK